MGSTLYEYPKYSIGYFLTKGGIVIPVSSPARAAASATAPMQSIVPRVALEMEPAAELIAMGILDGLPPEPPPEPPSEFPRTALSMLDSQPELQMVPAEAVALGPALPAEEEAAAARAVLQLEEEDGGRQRQVCHILARTRLPRRTRLCFVHNGLCAQAAEWLRDFAHTRGRAGQLCVRDQVLPAIV